FVAMTQAFGGFDFFDFEAVLLAQRAVRNGKDAATPPPLSVILALMQREGYRSKMRVDRMRTFISTAFARVGRLAAFINAPQFLRAAARMDWLWFPFGLDRWTFPNPLNPPNPANAGFLDDTTNQFEFMYNKLITPFDPAQPKQAILQAEYL